MQIQRSDSGLGLSAVPRELVGSVVVPLERSQNT